MTTTSRPGPASVSGWLSKFGRQSAYLLFSWPVLLAGFILVFTLLAVGVSTIIIWVGIPILVAGLGAARGLAAVERGMQSALLDNPLPAGAYRRPADGDGLVQRLRVWLTDPQAWFDVLFAICGWVGATVSWSITIIWYAGAFGGISSVIWVPFQTGTGGRGLASLLGWGDSAAMEITTNTILGVVFLASLPFVISGLAYLQSGIAAALLTNRTLTERVRDLEDSRSAGQRAQLSDLQRLERDIHDGPQQRLVRLSMDLGRALKQLDDDPTVAKATVQESLDQTRYTLNELRNLSRGIAPPVLVDRGLRTALAEAVSLSVVPTGLTCDPSVDQVPMPVAHAAYFVVSEALTNVAKHARASAADVTVTATDGLVTVLVSDNGVGGADLAKGTGLRGLADRVAGMGGQLSVESPLGGPTIVKAEMPCD